MNANLSVRKVGDVTKAGCRIEAIRSAGDNHQVVTQIGKCNSGHMRKPCPDCPWRKDAVGVFPADAFKHSAGTAYDMSDRVFACHQSGVDNSKTCAGFLLRGADHNLSVRMGVMQGRYKLNEVEDGGNELHDSYRAMAIANGVPPADPALHPCRP